MARADEMAVLSALLRELDLPSTLLSPLLSHARAVQAHAERLGLLARGDVRSVVSRHTADSLLFALARQPEPEERWVDVGSGAGFPGLVLACCYPKTRFCLVEPHRKRAGFLDLQVARLGLANAEVAMLKVADLDAGFDVATARALAEPLLALEALLRLAPRGAVMLAVGRTAQAPGSVEDLDVARPGVDSPGRIFMMAAAAGGA